MEEQLPEAGGVGGRRSQGERLKNMLEKRHSGVLPYSNATIDNVLLFLKLEEKILEVSP